MKFYLGALLFSLCVASIITLTTKNDNDFKTDIIVSAIVAIMLFGIITGFRLMFF